MCGMAETRDDTGLALEALASLGVRGEVAGQHLDRDGAIEPRVSRPIHLAHAAGTDERRNLVRAKPGLGGEGHRVCSVPGQSLT